MGTGGCVAFEDVAVADRFMRKADQHSLVLELEELRSHGDVIVLGEQEVVVSALPIVTENGPNGRTAVQVGQVGWDTSEVGAASVVNACVFVRKPETNGRSMVSDVECNVLCPR